MGERKHWNSRNSGVGCDDLFIDFCKVMHKMFCRVQGCWWNVCVFHLMNDVEVWDFKNFKVLDRI